jgi:hypothetical protein
VSIGVFKQKPDREGGLFFIPEGFFIAGSKALAYARASAWILVKQKSDREGGLFFIPEGFFIAGSKALAYARASAWISGGREPQQEV